MASQHGDTVIGATIGNGKFSYNTSKGTMSSSLTGNSGNQITAGENLITSMDDLMSKTDAIAEANRQRALDEKKNAFLKQKGGYTDEEISNMSPEEKATKLHDVGLNEQARGVIDEGQNTSRDEDEGFLSRTLNDMKDDLVGAIGVTSDKDGFIDAQGNYHQRTCFVAGTKVHTISGVKNIEDIKFNDIVLSWNEKTHTIEYNRVLNTHIRQTDAIYKIRYSNARLIETTATHPFYIPGRGWIEAKDLKVGNRSTLANDLTLEIVSIEIEKRSETVYNFEVENAHTYFVTEDAVLVHNAGYDPDRNKGFGEYVNFAKKAFSNGLDKVKSWFGFDEKEQSKDVDIKYSKDVDKSAIDEKTLDKVKDIAKNSGVDKLKITSAGRNSNEQTDAMFNNLQNQGVQKQRDLYGQKGEMVIDVYEEGKRKNKSNSEIKSDMNKKINELGCSSVSRHCSNDGKVIDIAPSSIDNDKRKEFVKQIKEGKKNGLIKNYYLPPKDPAYHIEFK